MDVESAGFAVGAFGLLALFARALGGILSDRVTFAKGSTSGPGCRAP